MFKENIIKKLKRKLKVVFMVTCDKLSRIVIKSVLITLLYYHGR